MHHLLISQKWPTNFCVQISTTDVINNKQPYSLFPWLMWEAGKSPSEMKYTFEEIATAKNPLTFPSQLYYEPIPNAGMPYLIQNVGY